MRSKVCLVRRAMIEESASQAFAEMERKTTQTTRENAGEINMHTHEANQSLRVMGDIDE